MDVARDASPTMITGLRMGMELFKPTPRVMLAATRTISGSGVGMEANLNSDVSTVTSFSIKMLQPSCGFLRHKVRRRRRQ